MSQKTYCIKCNEPTEYKMGTSPKFCSHCGNPFASSYSVAEMVKSAPKPTPKKFIIVDEEDEDEYIETPQIDRIEIEPIGNLRERTTVGSLAGTPKTEIIREKRKGKINNKQIIQEFLQETVSVKNKNRNTEISE